MTTHDRVIAAAKEAGIDLDGINQSLPLYVATQEEMERFYAIAFEDGRQSVDTPVALAEAYRCGEEAGRVAEREECAKVCDSRENMHRQNYGGYIGQHSKIAEAKYCADAIRARGDRQ